MNNRFYLFFLIVLALCLQSVHAANFILSAEGDGDNLKDAKASAVSALSQQIISQVESSFRTELNVKNENVDRESSSVKKISSDLILKGVIYVNEKQDGNHIRITAGLDKSGVFSTLDYMKKQLTVDYGILTAEKKLEALKTSDQLTALISVLPASIVHEYGDIETWNNTQRKLLLKHIYMGRVLFVSDLENYNVNIDGKKIENGTFLEAGNYQFTASAENHRTMNGEFNVSAGETVKVNLPFIKTVSNQTIRINLPNDYTFLMEEIKSTLLDLGIKTNDTSNNSLKIRVSDRKFDVDEYSSHQLAVRVAAYKADERIKKVTLRKNLIVKDNEADNVRHTLQMLTKKGIIELMSRMALDSYFSDSEQ